MITVAKECEVKLRLSGQCMLLHLNANVSLYSNAHAIFQDCNQMQMFWGRNQMQMFFWIIMMQSNANVLVSHLYM